MVACNGAVGSAAPILSYTITHRKTEIMAPFEPAFLPDDTPQHILDTFFKDVDIFMNDTYQVNVKRDILVPQIPWNGSPLRMIWLSVKRRDKEIIRDWRDMQEIKNMLVGPENEGVEIFPSESRLVDTANQYHLWVAEDADFRFPFGFSSRMVASGNIEGGKQRPFSSPPGDLQQCETVLKQAYEQVFPDKQ